MTELPFNIDTINMVHTIVMKFTNVMNVKEYVI